MAFSCGIDWIAMLCKRYKVIFNGSIEMVFIECFEQQLNQMKYARRFETVKSLSKDRCLLPFFFLL